jgi:hypothetical protein
MNAQEADTNEARRKALAAAIERHQSEIINKWLARVREDAEKAGHEVSLSELRDGIGDYLSSLADALRNSESAEIGGTDAWKRVAKEHALTRVRLGSSSSGRWLSRSPSIRRTACRSSCSRI